MLRYTRPPYEIILVDNGSTDGTPAYLYEVASLAGASCGPARVVVLRNDTNRGFAAGCNQALAEARGHYLVLLNNDTVVTEGWLDTLVGWSLHDWPHVGLVGPMSNQAPPPQLCPVAYKNLIDLPAFARRHRTDHAGKGLRVERLTGFCLLARREVLEQIGGLDEQFGVGFFEDDDLCVRAQQAGFALVLAQDVFIHHFGNRTFQALGLDTAALLRDNLETFKAKWGEERASRYQLPTLPSANGHSQPTASLTNISTSDESHRPDVIVDATAVHVSARQRVGLTMIVRNEEQNLPACLDSVADLVDQIAIADTGSEDRTKEIAQRYGAKITDFPWVDSFAAARNASLDLLDTEWAFFMDADDRLDAPNRENLRQLFASLPPARDAAYSLKCLCLPDPETGTATVVDHVRLFPLLPDTRWEFRVHEQVLPSLLRQGVVIRWPDVVIHHTGYLDAELRVRKRDRDLRLLRLAEQDDPEHPFTLFNLGCIYQEMKQPDIALPYLQRSLAGSHPSHSIVRKLYALIAGCQRMLEQPAEALTSCQAGRRFFPDDQELIFQEGLTRRMLGDGEGATACFEQALTARDGAHFGSVAVGLQGYKARQQLAILYAEQGRLVEADAQQRAALAEQQGGVAFASR